MSQDPARPAPRTRDEDWMSREEWLRRHQALRSAARGADCGLLWLGDSITEAWPTVGAAAWERVFAPRRALALGLGGDQT